MEITLLGIALGALLTAGRQAFLDEGIKTFLIKAVAESSAGEIFEEVIEGLTKATKSGAEKNKTVARAIKKIYDVMKDLDDCDKKDLVSRIEAACKRDASFKSKLLSCFERIKIKDKSDKKEFEKKINELIDETVKNITENYHYTDVQKQDLAKVCFGENNINNLPEYAKKIIEAIWDCTHDRMFSELSPEQKVMFKLLQKEISEHSNASAEEPGAKVYNSGSDAIQGKEKTNTKAERSKDGEIKEVSLAIAKTYLLKCNFCGAKGDNLLINGNFIKCKLCEATQIISYDKLQLVEKIAKVFADALAKSESVLVGQISELTKAVNEICLKQSDLEKIITDCADPERQQRTIEYLIERVSILLKEKEKNSLDETEPPRYCKACRRHSRRWDGERHTTCGLTDEEADNIVELSLFECNPYLILLCERNDNPQNAFVGRMSVKCSRISGGQITPYISGDQLKGLKTIVIDTAYRNSLTSDDAKAILNCGWLDRCSTFILSDSAEISGTVNIIGWSYNSEEGSFKKI